jgi:hypothetical protein
MMVTLICRVVVIWCRIVVYRAVVTLICRVVL